MTISTAFDLLNMAAPQQTFLKTSNAKETTCTKKNNIIFFISLKWDQQGNIIFPSLMKYFVKSIHNKLDFTEFLYRVRAYVFMCLIFREINLTEGPKQEWTKWKCDFSIFISGDELVQVHQKTMG